MKNSFPAGRPTQTLTAVCALVGFVSGCGLEQFQIYVSIGNVAAALALSFASFAWFRNDAWNRSYTRSTMLNIGIVSAGALVLPYYLLKSRGFKQGTKAIGIAVGIYLLYIAAVSGGMAAVRVARQSY